MFDENLTKMITSVTVTTVFSYFESKSTWKVNHAILPFTPHLNFLHFNIFLCSFLLILVLQPGFARVNLTLSTDRKNPKKHFTVKSKL